MQSKRLKHIQFLAMMSFSQMPKPRMQPDQGHTYLDALRDAYALVQPFDQAGTDRSTAFGGGREYRGASLPACQEWARVAMDQVKIRADFPNRLDLL